MQNRPVASRDGKGASSETQAEIQVKGQRQAYIVADNLYVQNVLSVKHYTDRLFSFTMTRPNNFRFRSGEFVMIGLPIGDKPIFRAYSIASPFWHEELEFFSIKVKDGPLTQHLQAIEKGDSILMRKKSTGTLVLDALLPGKRLYLISTGTGIAPFASLIRDPETYEKFEQIILVQTTREVAELQYGKDLVSSLAEHDFLSEFAPRLRSFFMTTRESSPHMGRITDAMASKAFFRDNNLPPLSPEYDRVMICGSMAMIKDCAAICESFGLKEGANNAPNSYVIERAFVG